MSKRLIIALDQGTSSVRAVAVDQQGRIKAQKAVLLSPQRPAKGFSHYVAEELLQTQFSVLRQLLDEIGPDNTAALAVCSQRSTVVLWDKNTGNALAPVLTWEDGRSVEQAQKAPISQEAIHAQTGLFKTPFFSAPKIAWCLDNYPEVKQAAQSNTLLAAPVASYLIWHLTQGSVFATDPTLAQRTLLWNIEQGIWSEELCQVFGVPITCLPKLLPSVANYGAYNYKGVSIPIYACVADQQAAAVYQGVCAGKTAVNYGTGAFVLHHTGGKLSILPGMLSSIAVSLPSQSPQFLFEGPIFAAGSLLQWLHSKGIEFESSQIDTLCAVASSPVRVLPALGGLGAPYWDYKTSFCVENVTSTTTSADWLAGFLDAISARVADIIYYLRSKQFTVDTVSVSGGLSNIAYLLQQQANILGIPLSVQSQTEATVLGAASLAAKYLEWAPFPTTTSKVISPCTTTEQAVQIYQHWQQFVQSKRNQ